jgi:transposase
MFLLWLADLPTSGCVKSRKALAPSARLLDQAMSVCSTGHDKLAANYLAFIKLASIRIWLRANEPAAQSVHRFV